MAANLVSTHLVMCLNRSLSIHHPIWYSLNIWMMFCLFSLIDCYNSLLAPPETVPVEVRHQRAQTSWQEEVQMLFAALLLPPPTSPQRLPAPTPRQRLVLLLHIRRRLSRASAHWIILWYKFFQYQLSLFFTHSQQKKMPHELEEGVYYIVSTAFRMAYTRCAHKSNGHGYYV